MELLNKTKQLFGIKDSSATTNPAQPINKELKQKGETYKQYGIRIAGLAQGSINNLTPSLHSVYFGLKKEQEKDIALQQQLKIKQQTEIENTEAEKKKCEIQLETDKKGLADLKDSIDKKDNAIEALKAEAHRRNRPAWIQLIISGVLLIPFTIYFFIFYSSVAYSAFFQNFDVNSLAEDGNFIISQAIFNPNALVEAFHSGVTEVLFILLMPIIFLAFGFILNRWERETGKLKIIKILALVLLAFIFDSLLSYEICEKIYNVISLTTLEERPSYGFGIAFQDPRFWIIIFLGFVSYIIWGLTFGYFVKALDDLDLNKITLQKLEKELKALQDSKERKDKDISDLQKKIPDLNAKINNLKLGLNNIAIYDFNAIKLELNNFYSGWQQYLANMGRNQDEKNLAQSTFQDFMNKVQPA